MSSILSYVLGSEKEEYDNIGCEVSDKGSFRRENNFSNSDYQDFDVSTKPQYGSSPNNSNNDRSLSGRSVNTGSISYYDAPNSKYSSQRARTDKKDQEKPRSQHSMVNNPDDFYSANETRSPVTRSLLASGQTVSYNADHLDDYDKLDNSSHSYLNSNSYRTSPVQSKQKNLDSFYEASHDEQVSLRSQPTRPQSSPQQSALETMLKELPSSKGVALWLRANDFDDNVITSLEGYSAFDLFELSKNDMQELVGSVQAIRLRIRLKQLSAFLQGNSSNGSSDSKLTDEDRSQALVALLNLYSSQNQTKSTDNGSSAYNLNNMQPARKVAALRGGSASTVDLFTSPRPASENNALHRSESLCNEFNCPGKGKFDCAGDSCGRKLCDLHATKDLLMSYYYCEKCFAKISYAPLCRDDLYQTFCTIQ